MLERKGGLVVEEAGTGGEPMMISIVHPEPV